MSGIIYTTSHIILLIFAALCENFEYFVIFDSDIFCITYLSPIKQKISIEDRQMVIILLDAKEALELIRAASERGMNLNFSVEEIINKYFPASHIMDKDKVAEGYKEMSAINLAIANGDQER